MREKVAMFYFEIEVQITVWWWNFGPNIWFETFLECIVFQISCLISRKKWIIKFLIPHLSSATPLPIFQPPPPPKKKKKTKEKDLALTKIPLSKIAGLGWHCKIKLFEDKFIKIYISLTWSLCNRIILIYYF